VTIILTKIKRTDKNNNNKESATYNNNLRKNKYCFSSYFKMIF